MTYIQATSGLFKLYNRLLMVETLFAAGMDGKAHKVLSKVRSVNPRMAGGIRGAGAEDPRAGARVNAGFSR